MHSPDNPRAAAVAGALLAWADAGHLRRLPWRREPRDPYAVWISEVMLQQTQVATVVPYFERWLEQFPTVQVLAAADLDAVLRAWQGLGYYARARNLHKAAGIIVADHGGVLPREAKALLALPGIGRYTAGAILSIAHRRRAAVLDGNVKRVLARLYDVDQDLRAPATTTRLWHLSEELVETVKPARAGRLNEALMDLGATVCTAAAPRCVACPLVQGCLAYARGTQNERPVLSSRRPIPHFDVTAAVLHRPGHPGQFLIAQRPLDGMLGGLWEFPGGKVNPGESLPECLRRELREELGIEVTVGRPLVSIKHAYTHFRITLHAFDCQLVNGRPQAIEVADWRWVTLADLDDFAFAATDRQIIAALADGGLSRAPQ